MRWSGFAAGCWMTLASVALAQEPLPPAFGNERFAIVDYQAEQVVRVSGAPGYATTIFLAPDERIRSIALGDSAAWQATPSRDGNYLFVKPSTGVDTNMTVVTDAREYIFELTTSGGVVPYIVRFRYPMTEQAASTAAPPTTSAARYRLSGSRTLRPSAISDDGVRVFIEWPADIELPAIYAADERGRETLLNGGMRDGRYVIDSINAWLVFRRDRHVARARRAPQSLRQP